MLFESQRRVPINRNSLNAARISQEPYSDHTSKACSLDKVHSLYLSFSLSHSFKIILNESWKGQLLILTAEAQRG